MRTVRRWEDGDFSEPRPLCFAGWPALSPASFTFRYQDELRRPSHGHATLYYRNGWTGLILWNGNLYFCEQILTFNAMLELIRSRFREHPILSEPIRREYVD
jgi:hypothetical protein